MASKLEFAKKTYFYPIEQLKKNTKLDDNLFKKDV